MSCPDGGGEPPAWAPFFSPQAWAHFVAVVAADLGRRGVSHELHAYDGFVAVGAGGQLGLTNLAQMCNAASVDRWPGLVQHHFDIAFHPQVDDSAAIARDFSRARSVIKLRLWGRVDLPRVPVYAWDVADDLVAVLSFDMPQTVVTAKPEDVQCWGVPRDELWRIAVANMHAEGLLEVSTVHVEGATVHLLEGDRTFFAASHFIFLEAYPNARAAHGCVVAMPRRHVVVFHPIVDLSVVGAIQSMIQVAPTMYEDGPGSISPSIYWWRPGPWLQRLPVEYGADGARFFPPPPFVELLNGLPSGPQTR